MAESIGNVNFMKKYLSIGEVSKIKGVSVKSLRYYGELGILPPIYINKQTGYRYYSVEQLMIVDLILVCLDLNIPLKNFREYITVEGAINIGQLLADGERIVAEKVKKLNNSIAFLDTMSKHVARTNKVKDRKEEFVQYIPKRYFLTADWNGDVMDYLAISGKYSKIYKQCSELNIPDTFNQGVLILNCDREIIKKVFVEIPCPKELLDNLLIIAQGKYLCKIIKDIDLPEALENATKDVLIIKELLDLKLEPQAALLEVQTI